ncbi:MAG: ATP-binding protein [Betaproteobacteria bacterium]
MKSIRRGLVLWLLGGLALGIAVVMAATYGFAYRQISAVFDEEMNQIAHAVHLREDWIEEGRVRIARPGFGFSVRAYDANGRVYFETVLPSMPEEAPQRYRDGFSIVDTAEGEWRVYTHTTPEGIVQVGQPEAARQALARSVSLRVAAPVLLLVPLLVALVAWALARGLAPLREISRRVNERDASRLDALPTGGVPVELAPLIEQINALLVRLGVSLDAQRRFVADAAHELRSPVAALQLQAQLAQRAPEGAQREARFADLMDGIARSGRLVEQLLRLARLEPGVTRELVQPVDLARLAREVVGAHAARAEARGVDLGADAPERATLLGAETELRSLLTNLLDNALRYAPRDSQVTVRVAPAPAGIELEVVDTGPGIPAAQRERVFERFQRVPGDLTPGSGLGLPIARAIAERHRGAISLHDTRPGADPPGLTVRVSLPRSAAER